MMRPNAPLSRLEATALMQVRINAKLDARLRAAVPRLIHFGFIDEGPDGFRLTQQGIARFRTEAVRAGLPVA